MGDRHESRRGSEGDHVEADTDASAPRPNRARRRCRGPGLAAQITPHIRSRRPRRSSAKATFDNAAEGRSPQPPPIAFTVPEFCEAHRISRALFYILLKDGRGPAIIKAGRRTLIAADAAAAWRRRMEAAAAEGPQP
jgi:hypothetical protein